MGIRERGKRERGRERGIERLGDWERGSERGVPGHGIVTLAIRSLVGGEIEN